jgi:hypothetical protein
MENTKANKILDKIKYTIFKDNNEVELTNSSLEKPQKMTDVPKLTSPPSLVRQDQNCKSPLDPSSKALPIYPDIKSSTQNTEKINPVVPENTVKTEADKKKLEDETNKKHFSEVFSKDVKLDDFFKWTLPLNNRIIKNGPAKYKYIAEMYYQDYYVYLVSDITSVTINNDHIYYISDNVQIQITNRQTQKLEPVITNINLGRMYYNGAFCLATKYNQTTNEETIVPLCVEKKSDIIVKYSNANKEKIKFDMFRDDVENWIKWVTHYKEPVSHEQIVPNFLDLSISELNNVQANTVSQ